MQKTKKKHAPFPSKEDILAFINESPRPVGKRDIARAFRIAGDDRVRLKTILKEIKADGLVEPNRQRRMGRRGSLPHVTVIEVTKITGDGDVIARPARWDLDDPPPSVFLAPDRRAAPGIGDRVLARLARQDDGTYRAKTIKRIESAPSRVLGVFSASADGAVVQPVERGDRGTYPVIAGETAGAQPGDLVLAEQDAERTPLGRRVRVVERLGKADAPGAVSLISVHRHDIPTEFTAAALAQASRAKPVTARGRTDLRKIPLVTIDGADARDFDDAVWAEPDTNGDNPGGWRLLVAIADVAHYVRSGDALDRCAYERGNSVYFPDRVIPMLPEALSNDLCSLRPNEDRACLAAHIWIGSGGEIRRHRFERAIMRSAARLTYRQVQSAIDGQPDGPTKSLLDPTLRPLFSAYAALAKARAERQTLDLDLPERKVILRDDGTVEGVAPVQRLDSHRLIEEFMIAANIAAAETLESRVAPCMYRVHGQPDLAKLEALRQVLGGLGYKLAKGQVLHARHFNQILRRASDTPHARLVHEMVLRSQSQAIYSPNNDGHFGLALRRYAHFTSPIRRYSDLLVHRALIGASAKGGIGPEAGAAMADQGSHLSAAERRAVAAERNAMDRYVAQFLADRVGAHFAGAITGVSRFGLFVSLDETGADGLIPMRSLSDDYYDHDERTQSLTGRSGGRTYRIGDPIEVRLAEANPLTGGLILDLTDGPEPGSPGPIRDKAGGPRVKRGKAPKRPKTGSRGRPVKRKARNRR